MDYFLLFIEGIMTFVSPCLLPMLPVYIAYFAGDNSKKSTQQILVKSSAFVLGFSSIFMLLSLFVISMGGFVTRNQTIINMIAGTVIMIIGLDYLNGQKLSVRLSLNRSLHTKTTNPFVFGALFALTWSPCVGSFLASVLTYITTVQNFTRSFFLILSYCLGIGLPFIFSALLIEESKQVFNLIKKNYRFINKISGIFLVLFGLLTLTGFMQNFLLLFN